MRPPSLAECCPIYDAQRRDDVETSLPVNNIAFNFTVTLEPSAPFDVGTGKLVCGAQLSIISFGMKLVRPVSGKLQEFEGAQPSAKAARVHSRV